VTDRVWKLRPEYAPAAAAMVDAVQRLSILDVRMREAVRYRMAQINGCLICQAFRSSAAREEGFTEDDYNAIGNAEARTARFSPREALAIDYAERFAIDHHSLDDEYFERMHELFTDPEIVDLTFFAGRYMAFGRLTHVLGLDDTCEVSFDSVYGAPQEPQKV